MFSLTFLHCFATELLAKLHDALGSADVTLHKKCIQLEFMPQPVFQTLSSVDPVCIFIFVQLSVKSFALGKRSLSLKVIMKFRGLRTHEAWGKQASPLKDRGLSWDFSLCFYTMCILECHLFSFTNHVSMDKSQVS